MGPYDHVIGTEVASGAWSWDSNRALLYAVGVGVGIADNQAELHFSTENTPGQPQQVIPTFATLMNLAGNWIQALGLPMKDGMPVGLVHGEEGVTLHRPIPVAGTVTLSKVITGVYDKGSGALVRFETRMKLADTQEPLATLDTRLFALGAGGFGGPRTPPGEAEWVQPTRAPDATVSYAVPMNQSLIYRLSGDHHPHGTWPERARMDGFDRPILYGLGTYGFTCRALLSALCDSDATGFGAMHARFSKPVYPGDRLDIRIWRTGDGAQFQTVAHDGTGGGERIVLDRGTFQTA